MGSDWFSLFSITYLDLGIFSVGNVRLTGPLPFFGVTQVICLRTEIAGIFWWCRLSYILRLVLTLMFWVSQIRVKHIKNLAESPLVISALFVIDLSFPWPSNAHIPMFYILIFQRVFIWLNSIWTI